MSLRVVIEIPRLPSSHVRGNSRAGWRAKAKWIKHEREMGEIYAFEALQTTYGVTRTLRSVKIHLDWYNAQWIDYDNLLAGTKPFIDGIVDAGVIEDDNPKVVKEVTMQFHKTKHRDEAKTVITIEEISDEG